MISNPRWRAWRRVLLGLLAFLTAVAAFMVFDRRYAPHGESEQRVLTDGCPYDARGIPECGVLLGAAYGGNDDPAAWEQRMGHQLGVRRTYYGPDDVNDAVATAAGDLTSGRLPWISFKAPVAWDDMAEGGGDAWANDIALRLAGLDGPVWIAFHHEPENDGAIRDWTRMQERLAPIVREVAPNVAFTVILTGYHQVFGDEEFALPQIWPDTEVDLAGFDVYERFGTEQDGMPVVERTPFDVYLRFFADFAREQGVAWAIAETGHSDEAAADDPGFVGRLYEAVGDEGGVAIAYFNSVLNSTSTWRLDPQKESAFATVLEKAPTLDRGTPSLRS